MAEVLRVAVPVPLPRLFDYLPPVGEQADAAWTGCRVRVAFGPRQVVGMVVETGPRADVTAGASLRRVVERLDPVPLAPPDWLATLRWASAYYAFPLGEVVHAALPAELRQGAPARRRRERWLRLAEPAPDRARPRAGTIAHRALEILRAAPRSLAELERDVPGARRAATRLREQGWVTEVEAQPRKPAPAVPGPGLNPEQEQAVTRVLQGGGGYAAYLLDGVTGSGKTEVYLSLIAAQLAAGRQSLVLVPEIGLTPQALQRYRERLGVEVAVVHSGLSDGERGAAWLAAAAGDAPVILGTRSAVFTPLKRPGLFVVDEEHDGSYKQQEGFRYSARDLAVVRAHGLGVPVVLGSATPSLESMHNAVAGRYVRLRLSQRAGLARQPALQTLDVRRARLTEGLSAGLIDAIAECVARREHALVFRNRRGYAPLMLCHACGWHAECPRCVVSMTVHLRAHELRCHHCGHVQRLPQACPECAGTELLALGAGTERIEAALAARFPGVPVIRVDRDTTRRKDAFADLLQGLPDDGPAILVGTQMLAKGHDLPRLTLTAIVNVDDGLFSADFRGAERIAQLVLQVAGRAGRGARPGVVVLQTHHPEHPLFALLREQGYGAFAEAELSEREALGFPPYTHLALLRAEAKQRSAVDAFLRAARASLGQPSGVAMRGPMPAPMALRAGFERAHLLLESQQRAALHAVLGSWVEQLYTLSQARRVRWSIDVDPVDLY